MGKRTVELPGVVTKISYWVDKESSPRKKATDIHLFDTQPGEIVLTENCLTPEKIAKLGTIAGLGAREDNDDSILHITLTMNTGASVSLSLNIAGARLLFGTSGGVIDI